MLQHWQRKLDLTQRATITDVRLATRTRPRPLLCLLSSRYNKNHVYIFIEARIFSDKQL